MRTIKFRMWDHFNEEMTYSENDLVKFFTKYNLLVDGENNPVLMQFTGLLDKNGKEIYEGDLIHRLMHVYWRVVFKDNKWIAESIKNSGLYLIGQEFVESEIIGNIHDQKPLEDKP